MLHYQSPATEMAQLENNCIICKHNLDVASTDPMALQCTMKTGALAVRVKLKMMAAAAALQALHKACNLLCKGQLQWAVLQTAECLTRLLAHLWGCKSRWSVNSALGYTNLHATARNILSLRCCMLPSQVSLKSLQRCNAWAAGRCPCCLPRPDEGQTGFSPGLTDPPVPPADT